MSSHVIGRGTSITICIVNFLKYHRRKTNNRDYVANNLERLFRATFIHENVCSLGMALRGNHARCSHCTARAIDFRIPPVLMIREL